MDIILGIGLAVFLLLGSAAGTFFGQKILSRSQYKREIIRLAVETAIKDFENNRNIGSYSQLPMSANLAFYYRFFTLLDQGTPPDSATNSSLEEMDRVIQVCLSSKFKHYDNFKGLYRDDVKDSG